MSYEIVPFAQEESTGLSEFELEILTQISIRGNQNRKPIDKYHPKREIPGEIQTQEVGDGRIKFGSLWEIHNLDMGDKRLTYAYRPRTRMVHVPIPGKPEEDDREPIDATATFYVTEFDENGAIARTQFPAFYKGSDFWRIRVSHFRHNNSGGIIGLQVNLTPEETDDLRKIVSSPEENEIALNALMNLPPLYKDMVKRNVREYGEREEEHRHRLDSVTRKPGTLPDPRALLANS